MILPGTPAWRRRAAVLFLAFGAALGARTITRDLPHEQTLIFRLDERARSAPLKLSASLTRAGSSEALAGMTITRAGGEPGDPRSVLRLPDGDYVVTIDWEIGSNKTRSADDKVPDVKEGETSRVERVTLLGGETIVHLRRRADPQ